MIVIGIDPGIHGAVSFFWPHNNALIVDDIPTMQQPIGDKSKCVIDALALSELLWARKPSIVFVEWVTAMHGWGSASLAKLMRAAGVIDGVVGGLGLPMRFVTARVWKKHFGISSDKETSRQLAIQKFPGSADYFKRKKDHNRAEAALIALYGSNQITKEEAA